MEKVIKKFSFILLIVLFAIFVLKCPIETFTGIPCPGCMMKTALYYLVQLDFEKAFYILYKYIS